MSLRTGRLHLRITLEGIEVPVVAATWQGQPNQTAIASIQIVPTPTARRIPFRTLVHLFSNDLYQQGEAELSRTAFGSQGSEHLVVQQPTAPAVPQDATDAAAQEAGGVTRETLDVPPDLLRYRCQFVGEVVARTYQKSASGTVSVVLQCAGLSNYWDMVAADKKGGMLFGGGRQGRFAGQTPAPFWDLLMGDTGQIFETLTKPPAMFPNLRGYTAGLMHLLEELVGVAIRRGRQGNIVVGKNQFMAMAALRLRLLQTIGVAGGDDSPLRLLRRQGFGSIWRVGLRGIPRHFSYRHVINALMPYTFYETVPVLGPKYTPPTGTFANYAGWGGYDTGFLRNSPQWAWIVQKADRIKEAVKVVQDSDLQDISTIADEEGSVDPAEYADFRASTQEMLLRVKSLAQDIYRGVTSSRPGDNLYQFIEEDGDLVTIPITEARRDEFEGLTDDEVAAQGYRRTATLEAEVIARLGPVASHARSIDRLAASLYQRLNGSTRLPSAPDPEVSSSLASIVAEADEISGYSMPPPGRSDEEAEASEPSHLYTDIFRPDVWFCAPPRSNVIFPDQVRSLSESRVFGQEPTRLMIRMSDKWLGSDILFDKWWYAPLAPGLFHDRPVGTSGSTAAGGRLSSDLMDHELMGGIIPIFQSMSDREMYLGARVSGFGGSDNAGEVTSTQKRYFQQVTNFILFRTRFAARNTAISCRYNPYLILGFPALVLDAPPSGAMTTANQAILTAASDAMRHLGEAESSAILELIKGRTGQHLLGTIQQLTHSADATGENCSTDFVLTYTREHNERLEYMGQDLVRLAHAATRGHDRTVRRRPAAVERVLRELEMLQDVYATEQNAGLDATRQLDIPLSSGGTLSHVGNVDDVTNLTQQLIMMLNNLPFYERQRIVQTMNRRTSVVFAIDDPIPRVGTPAGNGEEASEDYRPGQLGPNGFEIIEVANVTDQFQNQHRTTNVSGYSASDADLNQRALEMLERDLEEYEAARPALFRDADGDSAIDGGEDDARASTMRAEINRRRAIVDDYHAGDRTELVSLPFLTSPRDGRNRPITTITTDKVGVPVNISEIPQLVGVVGAILRVSDATVILRVFRITEDSSVEAGDVFDLGAEDILRPPWYSNVWTNGLIGGGVYLPYFGVGSIVDPTMVLTPQGADVFGATGQQLHSEIQTMREAVQSGSSSESLVSGILEGATIENAVDFLVHTYALTKAGGYDVDSFIRNYTWRPIATMFDIFGSGDLELKDDGNVAVGVEGFHSRAFGPHSNLFGLLPYTDIQSLLGIDAEDSATAARVDVRSRRYAIIQAYRMELLYLRGCSVS